MDAFAVLINEIQSLKKEILSLREQNISLYNELARQHFILNNAINLSDSQKLGIYLTRLAGIQTAEFICKNMSKVKSFGDKKSYLQYVLIHTESVSGGEYLEFGVYEGKTINIISSTVPDKIVYGFDSFEGLPEDWRTGFDKATFDRNGEMPQVNSNVRLIKGWFNETLPAFVKEHAEPCAFIHVDCDLYSSTKTIFDNLKDQIVSGTVIAFDEYFNYPGWQEGEYKAFMELVAEKGFEFEYIARTDLEQVAVKIK
ncbi:MAG: class I SAM-dependent methyltransferase [Selenomonadaceae bacterium]|nr:class I SAM-dependent methyltransferase [Selenomonadaceae bacterium]